MEELNTEVIGFRSLKMNIKLRKQIKECYSGPSLRCTGYSDAVHGYPYPTSSFSTKPSSNPSGLTVTNSGAQHPHPTSRYRTLSIKSPAHNRRRTVVCAEQSHPSRSPNDFRQRRNLPLQLSIERPPLHTYKWPNTRINPHGANRRLRRHLPNDLPNRFLV
jgi:hypothetical protein